MAILHLFTVSVLHLLTWSDYIDPDVITAFEKQYQVSVKITPFDTEQQREQQLTHNPSSFDLVLLSTQYLNIYKQTGWLEKLETTDIPNIKHVDPKWHHPFGVGYLWGITGIAYRADQIKTPPDSWSILFSPPEPLHQKVALFRDPNEIMYAALTGSRIPLPDVTIDQINRQLADMGLLPNVQLYETVLDENNLLVKNQVWIAQAFNSDTAFIRNEYNDQIKFVVPKEGGIIWSDYWSILSKAAHKKLAYQFVNIINTPKISAQNATYLLYPPMNTSAIQFMDDALKQDTTIFPSNETINRSVHAINFPPNINRLIYKQVSEIIKAKSQ